MRDCNADPSPLSISMQCDHSGADETWMLSAEDEAYMSPPEEDDLTEGSAAPIAVGPHKPCQVLEKHRISHFFYFFFFVIF